MTTATTTATRRTLCNWCDTPATHVDTHEQGGTRDRYCATHRAEWGSGRWVVALAHLAA